MAWDRRPLGTCPTSGGDWAGLRLAGSWLKVSPWIFCRHPIPSWLDVIGSICPQVFVFYIIDALPRSGSTDRSDKSASACIHVHLLLICVRILPSPRQKTCRSSDPPTVAQPAAPQQVSRFAHDAYTEFLGKRVMRYSNPNSGILHIFCLAAKIYPVSLPW
jgi:hypothetical protein